FFFIFCWGSNVIAQSNLDYQYDTVEYVYDTIYEEVYDTIVIKDTLKLPPHSNTNIENEKSTSNSSSDLKNTPPIQPSKKYAVGLELGVFYPFNEYEVTSSELVPLINLYQKNMMSHMGNLVFNYHHRNWILKTGLGYNQLREEITFKPTNLVYINTPFVKTDTIETYEIETQDGITQHYVTRVNTYYKTDSVYENTPYTNKFTYISIPIVVSYRFNNSTLHWQVGTGIITSYYKHTTKNKLYLNENNQLNYTNKNQFNKWLFSWYLETGTEIPLVDNMVFFPSVNFRHTLRSIYNSNTIYNYKPSGIGINLSVLYTF
ncbi:MAG: hypothetical protein MI922_15835, partial [Bacteroidales bacterium]|nr:hypothetical protein [Bacteroidales bacterium]